MEKQSDFITRVLKLIKSCWTKMLLNSVNYNLAGIELDEAIDTPKEVDSKNAYFCGVSPACRQ